MNWATAARIIILAFENGTPLGRELAKAEIRNMAKLLDEMKECTDSDSKSQETTTDQ